MIKAKKGIIVTGKDEVFVLKTVPLKIFGKVNDPAARAWAAEEYRNEIAAAFCKRYGISLPVDIVPIIEEDPRNPTNVLVDFAVRPRKACDMTFGLK